VIRAIGLTKVYGRAARDAAALLKRGASGAEAAQRTGATVAVDDVSFDVARGELFVVMGLSGSGKSTLVRMLNRLVEPTAGELTIDGADVLAMDDAALRELRNRRVSMVFQHFALLPHRTVLENAAYGLRIRGVEQPTATRRAASALEQVGLGAWGGALPSELSGGMKQRVGLARALATDADIMLMDEPFSALDPLIRREMQALVADLRRALGKTIIFITHDLNEAMRLGDRILILRDGRMVQLATRAELLSSPADAYVEDFVSDVDRLRVLTAADAARPLPDGFASEATAVVDAGRPLAEVVGLVRAGDGPVAVVDGGGRLIGTISEGSLLDTVVARAPEAVRA
jgi:glycine betaine/proline transport system ATP-binding protein